MSQQITTVVITSGSQQQQFRVSLRWDGSAAILPTPLLKRWLDQMKIPAGRPYHITTAG